MMLIHIWADAKKHALQEFPKEACGIVVADKYIPCVNIAPDPTTDFQIDDAEVMQYIIAKTLQAVIHSHPSSPLKKSSPSKQDMIGQVSTAVTWGIIDTDGEIARDPYFWGDFLFHESLIGKEFQAGVNDCYSIIRKWYFQRKDITLPEFPRDDSWWGKGEDMYMEGFSKAGFHRITKDELQDGDVVLGKVRSEIINHGGIYLDNDEDGRGLILHHLPNRLSRRETAGPWTNKAEIFLRYNHAT